MPLCFIDPRWDLLIAAGGLAAVLLARLWPLVLLGGVVSVALLKVRLARADAAMPAGRGSKLNHVFTWMLGVNTLILAVLRGIQG